MVHSFDSFIPICREINLPDITVDEIAPLKSYHAPIGQFSRNGFCELNIWVDNNDRVLQYDRDMTRIVVNGVLYRASCGAPYIDCNGYAVAMHVASTDKGEKRKRKRKTWRIMPSTVSDVIDTIADILQVYASVREGLVLDIILEINHAKVRVETIEIGDASAQWFLCRVKI